MTQPRSRRRGLRTGGWAAVAALACAAPTLAPAQGEAEEVFWIDAPRRASPGMNGSLAELARQTSPSIVALEVARPQRRRALALDPLGRRGTPEPVHGSAFVISRDGYAVTVSSLIEGALSVRALLPDGSTPEVTVAGTDPRSRIALLKLESDRSFEPLPLGDAADTAIGDWVIALGHPEEGDWNERPPTDHPPTLAKGILSGRERRMNRAAEPVLVKLLQTDLVLTDGYSGAPLIDMNGNAIGVLDPTLQPQGAIGIGFAVPIRDAKRVLSQLRSSGEVRSGWLGVQIQPVTPDLARSFEAEPGRGALVSEVLEDTPAAAARILRGDVILEVEGTEIERYTDLISAVSALAPGTAADLVVLREGERQALTAVLGTAPRNPVELPSGAPAQPALDDAEDASWGFEARELTRELARRFGLPEAAEGIVITRVESGGPAARAQLAPGDLIREANRTRVVDLEQLERALDAEAPLLWVQRATGSAYRVLERR